MRERLAGFLLCIPLTILPLAALGQSGGTTAAPKAVPTQTFKEWALDCIVPKTGEGAGKQVCFIHHETHAAADATQITARVVVRRAGADGKLALIVQLPPNAVQATGASFTIDASQPIPVAIQTCIPKFCYGAIEFTPDLQGGARAGHQINLSFTGKDKGAQQVVIPLAGITAALAALDKTGS
jgi:invasion protein IalB